MSKGWAHGTKEFKQALIEDSKIERARIEKGETMDGDAIELVWERSLMRCMKALEKTAKDARADPKSADWKVAICGWMKSRYLCRNRWLAENLSMGVEAGVCRYVKQLRDGERPKANKLLKSLEKITVDA